MVDEHDLLRWRERHQSHRVVPRELPSGGEVRLPGWPPLAITRRIKRGLRCERCPEVIWLDEARPDEPLR